MEVQVPRPLPPEWLSQHLPAVFSEQHLAGLLLWQWLALLMSVVVGGVAGWLMSTAFLGVSRRLAARTSVAWDDALLVEVAAPVKALFMLLCFHASEAVMDGHALASSGFIQVTGATWMAVLGVLFFRLVGFGANLAQLHVADLPVSDAERRGMITMVVLLRRVSRVVGFMVITALVLTRFEAVKTLGVSLLASAGVAGLVFGLAAQKSIGTLLSGIQLAVTQPVRVGDTVVLDGNYGTVEEVYLTYVVLKLWDHRRLVAPISSFLDKPFENWTRRDHGLLGVVEFPADFRVPVDVVRVHLAAFVAAHPQWDKQKFKLQVIDATDHTLTLRAMVSAPNPDALFDLRNAVREEMVGFLQRLEGGRYLPRMRMDMDVG